MANVADKFGLRPYRSLNGAPWNNAQNRYRIATGYGTNIFQGDLVVPVTGGGIERFNPASNSGGDAVLGVFNGCFFTDPVTNKPTFSNFYPSASSAATDIIANVIDDPMTIFLMNSDEAFPVTKIFANFNVDGGTGSTTTGISQVQLDASTNATTAALPVQVIDISQDVNNEDTSVTNTNVLVRINNHYYKTATTGIA